MTKDMTHGNPGKLILGFMLPLLLGNLFQQVYNLVDTIIVGRFLGVDRLAAVGATGSVNYLVMGFCMGMCNGFAVPISQRFGAGDEKGIRRYAVNCAYLSIVIAAVLTCLMVFNCRQILIWMRTPSDIIEYSYQYIVVIFAGLPAAILYNMVASIIRALGDSKTPVLFLMFSAFLNVLLDLFCIIILGLGVSGAAIATVISQAVSGICCLLFMYKKFDILKVKADEKKADRQLIADLLYIGLPMGFQYSITAIGTVILQSAVNALGSMAVASVTAANKISTVFISIFESLGATMTTYAGQNLGAGKTQRIRKGLLQGNLIGFCISGISFVFLFLFGTDIAKLFVDARESQILQNVRIWLLINAGSYCFGTLVSNVRQTIQGLGYSILSVCAGVMELIARGVLGFVLVPMFGFTAACMGNTFAWIMADLFLIPAYFAVMRKIEKKSPNTAASQSI